MLLLNIGILAGMYLGKQVLDTRRKIRANDLDRLFPRTAKTLPATSALTIPELDQSSLNHAKIGGASVLVVSASYFLYPALVPVSIGIIGYNLAPVLHRSFRALRSDRTVNNDSYCALVTVAMVGTGSYFAAAVHNVIYHYSHHLITKSRDDSTRLTTSSYQQAPEMVWVRTGHADQGDHWWSDTVKCWIRTGAVEQQIPLEQVRQDDGVIVTTGTTIPVDGVIIEGSALINQQALTGEASPLEKAVGDHVMAATIVLNGRIVVAAAHSGTETRINKLNVLLQQTRDYKTQFQLKGEAWANRAALPLLATSAVLSPILGLKPAMALLFSVPMNTVRSMLSVQTTSHLHNMMQQGALIKDGRVLEELHNIDTILFDKTGTLTQTQPEVTNIITCAELDADTLLALAAAAEQRLEHPIAQAIVNKATEKRLVLPTVTGSHYDLGLGVSVEIDGHTVKAGSQRFIEQAIDAQPLPCAIEDAMQSATGHTFIFIAVDNTLQGVLELTPRLRPEVPTLIKRLRQRDFRQLAIVSGDQQAPTDRMAAQLGMDNAYSEVLPQDKAELIKALQAQGRRVCFIGDGLNDAIAMKQANVSICLSSASVITSEVAQIVLVQDSLAHLPELFSMAEQLHQRLGRSLNFWLGFGAANALAVPLLAFGPFQSSLLYATAYATGLHYQEKRSGYSRDLVPAR